MSALCCGGAIVSANCCQNIVVHGRPSWFRRIRAVVEWTVPCVMMALVPKCPMCVATYVALWTGIGISISAAGLLRKLLIVFCIASLVYLTVRQLGRQILIRKKEHSS